MSTAASAFAPMLLQRRIAVTGMGAVTPLGHTLRLTWDAVLSDGTVSSSSSSSSSSAHLAGGIATLEESLLAQGLDDDQFRAEWNVASKLPCQVAAAVRGFEPDSRTARFVQFALRAGEEAAAQARLGEWLGLPVGDPIRGNGDGDSKANGSGDERERRRERAGACIGSGMSAVREFSAATLLLSTPRGARKLSPHFIPQVLPNGAASRLGLRFGLRGPNHAASTACAAGAHAIGDAMRCIQHGDADIMFAGGAESTIDLLSVAGFCRLRALSTNFNDNPQIASRPFDSQRDGFVMGEGAAVLVLEEWDHAKARGVPILAELRGYGLTGDGYHITSPDPEGRGAERAMNAALQGAGISPGEVEYVNAHATSTPVGDDIEARAIHRALVKAEGAVGCRTEDLAVSSTKGATGHLLGAAGALEAAFAVMSIVDGKIPPTRNLDMRSEDAFDVGYRLVSGSSLERNVRVSMSNSFGFGGTNASLVFASPAKDVASRR